MALLMFLTSVGFSMDIHFCQGKLKNIAFFSEAKTCHESMVICPMHGMMKVNDSSDSSDCCSNQKVELDELDAKFTLASAASLTASQEVVLVAYFRAFEVLKAEPKKSESIPPNPIKPYSSRDIYVLNEAFLL